MKGIGEAGDMQSPGGTPVRRSSYHRGTHVPRSPNPAEKTMKPTSKSPRVFRSKPRRGIGKVLIILGLALVTIGGIVGYGVMARPDPTLLDRPLTKVVSKGPFEHVVTEQGEIESSSNVEIRCEVKARGTSGITIISVVPEGTVVEQGEELVELDSTALDQERIQQQIASNTAEATAIQSKNTFEAAKIAKIEYLEGTFKQDELLILSEVFVAEQNLRTAELAFRFAERLGAARHGHRTAAEGRKFAVDKARKDLEVANTKLNVLRKYTSEKMLKQLRERHRFRGSQMEGRSEKASTGNHKAPRYRRSNCQMHHQSAAGRPSDIRQQVQPGPRRFQCGVRGGTGRRRPRAAADHSTPRFQLDAGEGHDQRGPHQPVRPGMPVASGSMLCEEVCCKGKSPR